MAPSYNDDWKHSVVNDAKRATFGPNNIPPQYAEALVDAFVQCPVLMLDISTESALAAMNRVPIEDVPAILTLLQSDHPEEAADDVRVIEWLMIAIDIEDGQRVDAQM